VGPNAGEAAHGGGCCDRRGDDIAACKCMCRGGDLPSPLSFAIHLVHSCLPSASLRTRISTIVVSTVHLMIVDLDQASSGISGDNSAREERARLLWLDPPPPPAGGTPASSTPIVDDIPSPYRCRSPGMIQLMGLCTIRWQRRWPQRSPPPPPSKP